MRLGTVAVLILLSACAKDSTGGGGDVARNVSLASSSSQNAIAGSEVAERPAVRVTTTKGTGVRGVSVIFSITSGGGTVSGATATTDDNGVATVGGWILGPKAGPNTLKAAASGLNGSPISFGANGVSGKPSFIVIIVGNNQAATVGTVVSVRPAVMVTDANGNAVAGVAVLFSVAVGGGSITGAEAITDVDGVATAGNWTLGGTVGLNTLTASVVGVASQATFAATGAAKVPVAQIALTSPASQTRRGTTVQLTAIPRDAIGNSLLGRAITWKSSDTSRATVDSVGRVAALAHGSVVITATSEGISGTATIDVTNVRVGANVDLGIGSEGSIAINPTDPANIVASSNSIHYYSLNGGTSWTLVNSPRYTLPDADAAVDPNVAFDSRGTLFRQGLGFPYLSNDRRGIAVLKSVDKGRTLPSASSAWAYVPELGAGNPDQGILTIDNQSTSPFRDRLYVIFSDYPQSSTSYTRTGFALLVSQSSDGGKTFSLPKDISDSPVGCQEHSSYVSTGNKGELYAAWIDGCGGIMFDKSLDGGQTWGTDVRVRPHPAPVNNFPISDDVRGNVTIDVDRSSGPFGGTIYVSSIDVNGPTGGAADAWIVRSTDGGKSWSNPVLLSDGPRGAYKYYFQPRISVAPNGRVDAVWYDTRRWSGTNTNDVSYDVYYSYSLNGGTSFEASDRVTSVSSLKRTNCPTQAICGQRVLYEYIGLASDNERAFPLWTDMRVGVQHQFVAEISQIPR